MRIVPIVEGHGEVEATPQLLRRFCEEAGLWDIDIDSPIRKPREKLIQEAELTKAIEVACRNRGDGVLVLFDGDDDCPATLGPATQEIASRVGRVPCQVVLAHREYEAWFLASIESLRGYRGVLSDAAFDGDPEAPRDAKGQLEAMLESRLSYAETTDQVKFSTQFDMRVAHLRSRSFRKLTKAFGDLMRELGRDVDPWPPQDWVEQA